MTHQRPSLVLAYLDNSHLNYSIARQVSQKANERRVYSNSILDILVVYLEKHEFLQFKAIAAEIMR